MTRLCDDPTRADMINYMNEITGEGFSEFDVEEAIYWFAHDWHSGQGSNLYAALCNAPFNPSISASYIDPHSIAACLYDELEARYTTSALPEGWTHIEA